MEHFIAIMFSRDPGPCDGRLGDNKDITGPGDKRVAERKVTKMPSLSLDKGNGNYR